MNQEELFEMGERGRAPPGFLKTAVVILGVSHGRIWVSGTGGLSAKFAINGQPNFQNIFAFIHHFCDPPGLIHADASTCPVGLCEATKQTFVMEGPAVTQAITENLIHGLRIFGSSGIGCAGLNGHRSKRQHRPGLSSNHPMGLWLRTRDQPQVGRGP